MHAEDHDARADLPILAFEDAAAFDAWLAAEPRGTKGLWLRLAKKGSGRASVTKAEAVDAALCHGWIDGQVDRYDEASRLIRFTPRRRASKWSEINRTRVLELIEAGRMRPAGLAEVDAAYAPASTAVVPPDLQAALDASPVAAAFFATLKGVNRYAVLHHVVTAKKAETRAKKIADLVAMLERHETVY